MGEKKARKTSTKPAATKKPAKSADTRSYRHPEAEALLRPDVGTQAQFRKKKPPATYRYDSSLSPALDWDGQNPTRELGEWLLSLIAKAASLPAPHAFAQPETLRWRETTIEVRGLQDAVEQLKRLGRPFLDWAGKAERLSFDVPTLPLFVHERLSTKAILETLKGHKRDRQTSLFDLFGDPEHPITDQVLRAYEHKDGWTNRMVLGDSLVVMNSLLHYEGLGGQVQMIYIDPPYGVKFGSNFQPFVRKRDVKHNDDQDMTREPEMVKAYRDTWELGLHSYLTYMRDRLLLARELLTTSGSVFVQISDENLHHVRELMDEVFGAENLCCLIAFRTTGGQSSSSSEPRAMTSTELDEQAAIPEGWRVLAHDTLYSQGAPSDPDDRDFPWRGEVYRCPANTHWSIADQHQAIRGRQTRHTTALNARLVPYVVGKIHRKIVEIALVSESLKGPVPLHLILEIKGYDPLKEVKAQAAARWVAAVNADGAYGQWAFAMTGAPTEVAKILREA